MNIMKDVAHKLGVEIGEKFAIGDCERNVALGTGKFEDDGLYLIGRYGVISDSDYVLKRLLNGTYKVCKMDETLMAKETGLEDVQEYQQVYVFGGSPYMAPCLRELNFNEFTDEKVKNDWERAIEIYKRLAKVASELNTEPIDWDNKKQEKWSIFCDNDDQPALGIGQSTSVADHNIYFTSSNAADMAIDRVGANDLLWLFNEFEPFKGYYPSPLPTSKKGEQN